MGRAGRLPRRRAGGLRPGRAMYGPATDEGKEGGETGERGRPAAEAPPGREPEPPRARCPRSRGRPPRDVRRSVRAGGGPGDRITSIPPGTASRTDPARGIAGRPGAPGTDRGPDHVRKPSPGPTRPVLVRHAPCRRRRPCAPLGQPGTGGRAGGDRALHLPELLLVPAGRSAPRRARRAREPHRSRVSRRLLGPTWSTAPPGAGRTSSPTPPSPRGSGGTRRGSATAASTPRRSWSTAWSTPSDRSAAGCYASSNAPPAS